MNRLSTTKGSTDHFSEQSQQIPANDFLDILLPDIFERAGFRKINTLG